MRQLHAGAAGEPAHWLIEVEAIRLYVEREEGIERALKAWGTRSEQ